jgi:fructose-bisphosphate aldolase, class I
MVVAGKECTRPVADATWGSLRWHVPAAVLGIVFPSGAQHGRLATAHLNAINRLQTRSHGRSVSPPGGRFRIPLLEAWQGRDENFAADQQAFCRGAGLNRAAGVGMS